VSMRRVLSTLLILLTGGALFSCGPHVAKNIVWAEGCDGSVVFAPPMPGWAAGPGLDQLTWLGPTPSSAEIVGAIFGQDTYFVPSGQKHPDGGANKVAWISRQPGHLIIDARLGQSSLPTATFDLGQALIPQGSVGPNRVAWHWMADLPTPGCWHLQLRWGGRSASVNIPVKPGVPATQPTTPS
jgi:hypothetical protein